MKALVLAAGHGKRLRELSKNCPKPLIRISKVPLIYFALYTLKQAGISNIIINLHHMGEQIQSLLRDGKPHGFTISYSMEPEILGTGGAIKKVEPFFAGEENFVIINSDIVTNISLDKMIAFHLSEGATATLGAKEGIRKDLYYDECGRLLSIARGVPDSAFGVFLGVQVVNREIFGYSPMEFSSSITTYRKYIEENKKIQVFLTNEIWYDFGNIDTNPGFEEELTTEHTSYLDQVKAAFPGAPGL